MAIKGLTDRGLSFPEIGQVRKGAKKTDEKRPGKDLDYFRVEFDEQEQETAKAFRAVYGHEPREIRIILPFNEIERMWDPFLEAYVANRMVARADGENLIWLVDTKSGKILVKNGLDTMTGQPRPYADGMVVAQDSKGKPIICRPVGRLKVIIPELARAAYLTVMTTSQYDIANISSQFSAFKALNGGRIAGIPLILRRRPRKVSVPTQGGRARMTKWLLSIEADPAWVKAKLAEVKHLALPGNGMALLSEPENEIVEAEPQYVDAEEDWEPPTSAPTENFGTVEEESDTEIPEQTPTGRVQDAPDDPIIVWLRFCRENEITKADIYAALGTEKVSEWLAADESRTLEKAMQECLNFVSNPF